MLQHHLFLHLQLLVHTDGIQDEDGGDGLTVAGQEVAELRLQQLFPLLKTCFLQTKSDLIVKLKTALKIIITITITKLII